MTDRFETEVSDYGLRVIPISNWSDELTEWVVERNIKDIYLNDAKGWKGKDISFLKEILHLEAFKIIDWSIEDVSPINSLHSLKYLSVDTYCKTQIDFSQFPQLERCFIDLEQKAKNLFGCKTLKYLYINHYKSHDSAAFSELTNLEELHIGNSPLRDVEGLAFLKKLKKLGLYYLTKLPSLKGIEGLTQLEELDIKTCRKINSINEVRNLRNLKILDFSNCGEIESLKPMELLNKLEGVFYTESTNILDGDLTYLTQLKDLKKIAFRNRKHYSHTCEELWEMYGL